MTLIQPNKIMEKMNLSSIIYRRWPINACVFTTGEGVADGMKWLVKTFSKSQEILIKEKI